MANELWSQDNFTRGELSPYMYARATTAEYSNGLKKAQNVLTYPTGAAGKRFGTLYQVTLSSSITKKNEISFATWQYLNECIYQLVFYPGNIDIYLEGVFVKNIPTTLTQPQIASMSNTVLQANFRVATINYKPHDLIRTDDTVSPISITKNNNSTFLLGSGSLGIGSIAPVKFTGSPLATTTPQIYADITYFIRAITNTTFSVYLTAYDAKFNTNAISIDADGTTETVSILNNWSYNEVQFKNVPAYDFNSAKVSYDGITFTLSATSGASVTVTLSSAYSLLTTDYIGGVFRGVGGSGRITAVASTTSFTIAVQETFNALTVLGSLAYLAEPAWSNKRGWPTVCSSYQSRALFANNASLTNGFWASVINDYADFGDLTNDPDDAIAWYPSNNDVNSIRFIVPYRSITVHTNSGIYSTPLSDVAAITPDNFTLQLQDSTPATVLLPQAIDNQVVVVSGNDVHQMLWDGINNAYTSNIVSVISEQVIRNPIDEAAYADLTRAGSRYVFIVNDEGSMAVFQTLISQNVAGFTPQVMEQSNGNAGFVQVASTTDGRAWFIVQREIAEVALNVAISGFTTDTLISATPTYPFTSKPTAVRFTTTGTLPAPVLNTPAINTTSYFWAVWVDLPASKEFKVYATQEDALAGVNNYKFSSAGINSNVVTWPLQTKFTLEELTHDTYLDCAVYFDNGNAPNDTVNTGALFNTQNVKMVGDGYGFEAQGINDQVIFESHGVLTPVTKGYIGFPINTIIEPMPLICSKGPSIKSTSLTWPTHIRMINFMFNDTIGGTINGVPIAIKPFNQTNVGSPPTPARGIFSVSPMGGWDDFNYPSFTIEHNEPFNIQLLGVFYSVDI